MESSVASAASSLLGLALGGSSVGSTGLAGGGAGNLGLLAESTVGLGEGVESLHKGLVLEGVLPGGAADGVVLTSLLTEFALDLVTVDDASEVGAVHNVAAKSPVLLLGGLVVAAVEAVQAVEGILSEDHEAANVTTRGELEEVEAVNVADVNAGKVAGGALDVAVVVAVDDKGSLSQLEAVVAHLVATVAHGLGGTNASKVAGGTNVVENGEQASGAFNVEAVQDEGKLSNAVNVVTTGLNEGSDGRGSEGSSDGVSLLALVDLAVPLAPGLEGSEHTTLAAHVTEGGLAGAGGAGARDTGDTGDGATSAPRLSGVLVADVLVDTVGLTSVLGHVGVHELHDVISDGSVEDGREGNLADDLVLGVVQAHSGSRSHLSRDRY